MIIKNKISSHQLGIERLKGNYGEGVVLIFYHHVRLVFNKIRSVSNIKYIYYIIYYIIFPFLLKLSINRVDGIF